MSARGLMTSYFKGRLDANGRSSQRAGVKAKISDYTFTSNAHISDRNVKSFLER